LIRLAELESRVRCDLFAWKLASMLGTMPPKAIPRCFKCFVGLLCHFVSFRQLRMRDAGCIRAAGALARDR